MPYDLMDKEISKLKLETNPSYYDGYTKAIVAKQNDINSRLLCVDIFASGERVDISKYSTKMNVKMPNNKHLATNGQLIDGNLYFRIYDSMLTQIGHISCDVSLYKECINVVADTDGSINYTDVTVEQDTFINKVGDLGSYIFEYNDTVWMFEGAVIALSDYGITLNENAELFSGDKIIVSYSNYMLLTTETFFIVVQEKNHSEDADIPVDSNGKVFEYINADDILIAIEQTHTHTNKDILDNTTAIYTTDDKIKLTNIDTNLYVEKSVMGKANGVATLDNSGLVPSAQLPSFVDDTIEGYTTNATAFSSGWLSLTDGGDALTPEKGKIYIVVSDGEYKNKQYRWGGTTYVLCNPSDVNSVNGKTGIVELILDDIPNGTNFVHTTNDFSNSYKTKLEGIEDGAQVNVNADWNAVEGEASFIKNKPLIPEGSKLYTGVGSNTDGSIHQKGITDLLANYMPLSAKNDFVKLYQYNSALVLTGNEYSTLKDFFDYFVNNKEKIFRLDITSSSTDTLSGILGTPTGFSFALVLFRYYTNSNDAYQQVELSAVDVYSGQVCKGYITRKYLNDYEVVWSGWHNDNDLVTLNTSQTISGAKTFTGQVGNTQTEAGVYLGLDSNAEAPNANMAIVSANTASYIDMGRPDVDYDFRIIKWNTNDNKHAQFVYGGNAAGTITIPQATGVMALTSDIASYFPESGGISLTHWKITETSNTLVFSLK